MVQWILLGPFFRKHKFMLLSLSMVGILSSMSAILLPISMGGFYSLMFGYENKRLGFFSFLPTSFFESVPNFLLFFSALIFLNMLLAFSKRYLLAYMGELLSYELRNKLFARQLKMETRIYEEKGVGKYLLRYSGDLKSIQNYFSKGIIGFAVDLFMILLFLWVLSQVSLSLTLISLLAFTLMIFPLSYLIDKLQHISERRRNQKSGLLAFVSQRLQAIITLKAFNRESPEWQRFLKRSRKNYETNLSFHRLSSLIHVLVPGLLYSMVVAIMLVIYRQKSSGIEIDQAALLSAFLLIISMLPVMRRCLRIMHSWKLGLISIRKFQQVLELPTEEYGFQDELVLTEGDIKLSELSFDRNQGRVFDKLSIDWKQQGLHLVTGATGSGKSLLIKLLLGIYTQYEGNIYIDEQDIRQSDVKSLRKLLTVISDDYPLLGKTVFEAISYSRKASKRKGARLMLDKLQKDLPAHAKLSLDDKIGSQGKALSKGQERILLFTRALLTRKPILLLDEPFTSIDPQIKVHLLQLVKKLRKKRTIILFQKHNDLVELDFDSVTELDSKQSIAEQSVVRKLRA